MMLQDNLEHNGNHQECLKELVQQLSEHNDKDNTLMTLLQSIVNK